MQGRMVRATHKLQIITTARAFDSWKNTEQRIIMCKHACYQIVGRRVGRRQSRAFKAWCARALEAARFKFAGARILCRSRSNLLGLVYGEWHQFFFHQHRLFKVSVFHVCVAMLLNADLHHGSECVFRRATLTRARLKIKVWAE